MKEQDVFVVIRSVGERTQQLCKSLVSLQVSEENIAIVSNIKPFSKAVQKSFELGIASRKKWMVAVDADVLLFPNTIKKMKAQAAQLPNNLFFYGGIIQDKLCVRYRPGGPHLYKVAHLKKAFPFFPKSAEQKRPESFVRNEMVRNGYLFVRKAEVYGIHDFEQYYFDIYRKGFFQAKKHPYWVATLIAHWSKHWTEDKDFLINLKGLTDGLLFEGSPPLSPDFFIPHYQKLQSTIGLVEKEKLQVNVSLKLNEIVQTMASNFDKKIDATHAARFAVQYQKRTDGKNPHALKDLIPLAQWKLSRLLKKIEPLILSNRK